MFDTLSRSKQLIRESRSLTGVRARTLDEPGTINYLVAQRLREMSEKIRDSGAAETRVVHETAAQPPPPQPPLPPATSAITISGLGKNRSAQNRFPVTRAKAAYFLVLESRLRGGHSGLRARPRRHKIRISDIPVSEQIAREGSDLVNCFRSCWVRTARRVDQAMPIDLRFEPAETTLLTDLYRADNGGELLPNWVQRAGILHPSVRPTAAAPGVSGGRWAGAVAGGAGTVSVRPVASIVSLDGLKLFSAEFLQFLGNLRFTCAVEAVPEGTICFADEPILK